jgi:hypothetical protein
MSAASSYLNVTQAVAATAFQLDCDKGCTKFLAGEGVAYTRLVDLSAPLFQWEHRRREERKRVLREELQRMHEAVEVLQEAARRREGGHHEVLADI